MNETGEGCVRKARLVGFLFCAVPTVGYWLAMTSKVPEYRSVYTYRLLIALVAGGYAASVVFAYACRMWLTKHGSTEGPATPMDGALLGAAAGMGANFIPPLTSLIGTNHPEEARLFIIWAWVISMLVGAVGGGAWASMCGCPGAAKEQTPAA